MKLEKDLEDAILKVCHFFEERDITFVIVGALVPTVLIDMRTDSPGYGSRITRDVDYVIRMSNWKEYQRLKGDMLRNDFTQKKNAPEHRLFLGDTPVDIIPYSRQMLEGEMLIWPNSGFEMNTRGFENLFRFKEAVLIGGSHSVPFTPLPLAVFLKIHCYFDRNDSKDLEDIFYILINFESIEMSEHRFDVIDEKNIDYDTAGAFLLGRDLYHQIGPEYCNDMEPFITMFAEPDSTHVQEVARLLHKDPAEIVTLVKAFNVGLKSQS